MKDAYYFPHDSNSRHDPKLVTLCAKFGHVGYACFYITIEMLREQNNYTLKRTLKPCLSVAWNIYGTLKNELFDEIYSEMVKLDLIQEDGENISCRSLTKRMEPLDSKRHFMRKIGKKGGQAHAQAYAKAYAQASKVKESKGKELLLGTPQNDPLKTVFTPPSLAQVEAYVATRSVKIDPLRFIDYYSARGWMLGKVKMKDWQAAVRTWEQKMGGHAVAGRGPSWENEEARL